MAACSSMTFSFLGFATASNRNYNTNIQFNNKINTSDCRFPVWRVAIKIGMMSSAQKREEQAIDR